MQLSRKKFAGWMTTASSGTSFPPDIITYMEQNVFLASVAGIVERVNQLISITPVKMRYNGEIGYVAVRRIMEVQRSDGRSISCLAWKSNF